LSLTNTVLPGGLYGWLNEQGTYEFAAASMNIIRNPLSYFVRKSMLFRQEEKSWLHQEE